MDGSSRVSDGCGLGRCRSSHAAGKTATADPFSRVREKVAAKQPDEGPFRAGNRGSLTLTLSRESGRGLDQSAAMAARNAASVSRKSRAERSSARIARRSTDLPVNGNVAKASGTRRADIVASVSRNAACA